MDKRPIRKRIEALELERAEIAEEIQEAVAELRRAIDEEHGSDFVDLVLSQLGEKPN